MVGPAQRCAPGAIPLALRSANGCRSALTGDSSAPELGREGGEAFVKLTREARPPSPLRWERRFLTIDRCACVTVQGDRPEMLPARCGGCFVANLREIWGPAYPQRRAGVGSASMFQLCACQCFGVCKLLVLTISGSPVGPP